MSLKEAKKIHRNVTVENNSVWLSSPQATTFKLPIVTWSIFNNEVWISATLRSSAGKTEMCFYLTSEAIAGNLWI